MEPKGPPDAAEVAFLSHAIETAVAAEDGLTETQRVFLGAAIEAMTTFPASFDGTAIDPDEFARGMAGRAPMFRGRIIQMMILGALVLRPIPPEVADRVQAYARAVDVQDDMLPVAEEFARGNLGLAAFDFARAGYTGRDAAALHTTAQLEGAWDLVVDDPALAARWQCLEELAEGTLGRRVSEFYRARGFVHPGLPGSAPPLLAQHDWVHVLADFGTTVESELEVFAFIARANDDLRAFSLLAMVVSLFETGYLRSGAGLFEADAGHLSETGVGSRVADAMRRGALCTGSIDFLSIDWFDLASLTVTEAREHFGVLTKRAESPGPWEPGGISPYQLRTGQALAERTGRPYDAFGATK